MLRLFQSLKQYKDGHQPLYYISIVILFWAIADGIASFSLPIFLKQTLNDLSLVGLVIGSSSFFGLIADFIMGSEQKGRTFKPYFVGSVIMAIAAYFLSLKAQSWLVFLLIMAFWGFYYETFNFALIDFLSRFTKKWEHAQSSGVVNMFFALGYLLAPLIAGYVILRGRTSMTLALVFMLLSAFSFLWWFGTKKVYPEPPKKKLSFLKEMRLWFKVGRKSTMVLIGLFLLNIWDSLIWSMGPIFLISSLGEKAAYVMACFGIPRVFLQGYAGRWADKRGKKQFLISGLVIAGLFLSLFSFTNSLIYKIIIALASAVGAALVWPAVDGLFVDMIDGYKEEEEEVAGVRGLAHNLGYILGPIIAGFLGSSLGLPTTFFLYGIFLVVGALLMKLFWK